MKQIMCERGITEKIKLERHTIDQIKQSIRAVESVESKDTTQMIAKEKRSATTVTKPVTEQQNAETEAVNHIKVKRRMKICVQEEKRKTNNHRRLCVRQENQQDRV